jgi:uncharacterized protein DUF6599
MLKMLDLGASCAFGVLIILIASLPGTPLRAETSPSQDDARDLSSFLPAEVQGYAPQEQDGSYTADTLFDLIDGGAEVYRSFHVRRVVSRRYGKKDAADLLVDLFDMGSSRDAFGAYHHDLRDGEDAGTGAESEIAGSALAFWKDRYFVSIVPLADAPETRSAAAALGKEIARRIPGTGAKPEVVGLLPAGGLERDRIAYFHDWTYLNTRKDLAEENLLLLDGTTEGILARYREPAHLLLIARYPSPQRAKQAAEKFRSGYLQGADAEGVVRREDGTWAAAQAQGDLVVAVLESVRKPDMGAVMAEIRKALERREEAGHER